MVLKMSCNENENKANLLKLYLKDNRINNLLLIVLSMISAYLSYGISQRLKTIFNFVYVKDNFKVYIVSITLMYVALFALNLLVTLFQNLSSFKGDRNLMLFSTNRVLRADYSYFVDESPNKLFADVKANSTNVATFLNSIIMIISNFIQFLVYFIIIFNINIYAGVFSLIFIPFIPLSTLGINKNLTKHQEAFRKKSIPLNGEALEVLTLSKNIKAKHREEFFSKIFEEKTEDANKSMIRFSVCESYCNNIITFITTLAPILIMYVLVTFIFKDSLKREDIIILYLFIPLFIASFQKVYDCVLQFFKMKPYIDKFNKYMTLESESSGNIKLNNFESLNTKDLKVSLLNGKTIVIPNMFINKGDKVLIKGTSGIGKSTLFNILLGLRSEYEGTLEINGINIKELDIDSVREVIGISFQNNGVYSMSIEDNIKLGEEVNIDDLINMVELDQLLKDKKDSIISANTISGGEKSRITLAQNICASPEVILIDESTASLDEDMEDRILKNITKACEASTIVCISHRKSTEKYFSKIISF